jgi:hypothetical protein
MARQVPKLPAPSTAMGIATPKLYQPKRRFLALWFLDAPGARRYSRRGFSLALRALGSDSSTTLQQTGAIRRDPAHP